MVAIACVVVVGVVGRSLAERGVLRTLRTMALLAGATLAGWHALDAWLFGPIHP